MLRPTNIVYLVRLAKPASFACFHYQQHMLLPGRDLQVSVTAVKFSLMAAVQMLVIRLTLRGHDKA